MPSTHRYTYGSNKAMQALRWRWPSIVPFQLLLYILCRAVPNTAIPLIYYYRYSITRWSSERRVYLPKYYIMPLYTQGTHC